LEDIIHGVWKGIVIKMARPITYKKDDELVEILAWIEHEYGYIGIDTMNKAAREHPIEIPSYKMFERRLGGMSKISTKDFRNRLKPFLDKWKDL